MKIRWFLAEPVHSECQNQQQTATTMATAPRHVPGLRTPSAHDVGKQVNPGTPVFVHDPPDGRAAEQSPTVSALIIMSDASQFAARGMRVSVMEA